VENQHGNHVISIKKLYRKQTKPEELDMTIKRMLMGLLVLWSAAALFSQERTPAVIREISGTVEVKAPGAAAWSPAARGQALERSAVISTGFKSSALIAIGNSTLSVQPLTRLSLEELAAAENAEKVDINLRTGRVRANVKPPAGGTTSFTVRSPSATASVRGTAFEFNGLQLRVEEGRVHLSGGDGGGTYVGSGHLARTSIETGRTLGTGETAREELAPFVPAGVDRIPAPASAVPSASGDIDAGFVWN
jgi:hypothetical protein